MFFKFNETIGTERNNFRVERTCKHCRNHGYHWYFGELKRIKCANCGATWKARITERDR